MTTRYRAEIRLYVEIDDVDYETQRRTSSLRVLTDVTVIDISADKAVGQLYRHLNAMTERYAPDEPENTFDEECPF